MAYVRLDLFVKNNKNLDHGLAESAGVVAMVPDTYKEMSHDQLTKESQLIALKLLGLEKQKMSASSIHLTPELADVVCCSLRRKFRDHLIFARV